MWCCDARVVKLCADHSPWVGGENTKFDPGDSGWVQAPRLGRPGRGTGVNMLLSQKNRALPPKTFKFQGFRAEPE